MCCDVTQLKNISLIVANMTIIIIIDPFNEMMDEDLEILFMIYWWCLLERRIRQEGRIRQRAGSD